jgi:HTH-type transcriptional regulator/antitoxin HigA
MKTSKYTTIINKDQYNKYCNDLEKLIFIKEDLKLNLYNEINLLTSLIEKWDNEHNTF